jgi:MFS family permease
VLVLGTVLSSAGYAMAGLSGGLVGLSASLALASAGSGTHHPLASAAVSRAYGEKARGPLGTYNFAGDLGKATLPPLISLLLTVMHWRSTLWIAAGLGILVALLIRWFTARSGPSGRDWKQDGAGRGSKRRRRLRTPLRHWSVRYRGAHGLPAFLAFSS